MSPRTPRKGFSIVIKVALLAGSIAALASLIVGTLIVEGSSDIVYQNALNRLQYETNIKSLKLISDIRNLSGDAQYLVGTPPIKGIPRATHNGGIDPLDGSNLATWHDRLATIFSELIRAKPNYLQIRYIGIANNGRELVRVDRQGSLIRAIADEQLQQKGDTPYFKNAARVNLGEVYLSDINLNRELGKVSEPYIPVIRAATPVYFNDRLFGMLVINMSVRSLFEELIVNTPRELTPYITNEDGYFLAHPDNEMTYGFDLDNDHRIQSSYADLDLKQNKDIRDREFTVTFNDDVIHVVKAHYDPLQKQRFIAVMLATSNKNLQSGYDHLRLQNFFIMALLVVISLIIAALLASRLLRPLRLITIASDDLANGREVGNLPVEANDEIGELARSFADMYRQLEDKERELIVSQGRVHHMNKMASLGEMAATMAHEINSPIQTINLVAQRVQRQLKKDMSVQDIHASMDKIISGVNKTSEIIDSLRKISRDSEDDDYLEIHLSDLIEDVLNLTEER
ncbi:MAG: HAMP domain-containing protein, partial [Gammaproteobacteria bacterium]|nr:HAMP domain-containing protein [Gammaproteobacteria bacterium]